MSNYPRWRIIGCIVLICVVVVLVIGGIYLWQNLVFVGETRPLANTPHHLLIQEGVSEDEIGVVAEGITLANHYFTSKLGAPLNNPIEIRMARTTPCLPFLPLASNPTAVADKESMCLNMIGFTWTEIIPQDRRVGLSIIAHEHFHNWQAQFGCLPGPNDHEYAWWVEGSATYVGWHTLVEAGIVTEADVLNTMRQWGGFSDEVNALSSYETGISGDAAYALAYRAIYDLVENTGAESLSQFCQQVGQGQNWQTTFEDVYGLSVDDFYARFETLRQQN